MTALAMTGIRGSNLKSFPTIVELPNLLAKKVSALAGKIINGSKNLVSALAGKITDVSKNFVDILEKNPIWTGLPILALASIGLVTGCYAPIVSAAGVIAAAHIINYMTSDQADEN